MAERITGHTELIGLIATPIRHSMSPTMHNEAFAHLGLDYVYLAFEVGNQELKDVVQGFRAMKLRGFNVSMPNKTEICQYLDKLSPAAQLVGGGQHRGQRRWRTDRTYHRRHRLYARP